MGIELLTTLFRGNLNSYPLEQLLLLYTLEPSLAQEYPVLRPNFEIISSLNYNDIINYTHNYELRYPGYSLNWRWWQNIVLCVRGLLFVLGEGGFKTVG